MICAVTGGSDADRAGTGVEVSGLAMADGASRHVSLASTARSSWWGILPWQPACGDGLFSFPQERGGVLAPATETRAARAGDGESALRSMSTEFIGGLWCGLPRSDDVHPRVFPLVVRRSLNTLSYLPASFLRCVDTVPSKQVGVVIVTCTPSLIPHSTDFSIRIT